MGRHPIVAQLVQRRLDLGLSQRALSRRITKTARAVCHFENDPGGRHLVLVEEVASALGMRLVLVPVDEEGA